MKRALYAFLIVVALVFTMPFVAFAEETTAEPFEETTEAPTVETNTEETTETPTQNPTEAPTSPEDGEDVTLLDRIAEAWENGEIGTVISLALDVAIIVFVYIAKKANKKGTLEVAGIFADDGAYSKGQKNTVKAVNNLIEAANDVVKAVEGDGGLKGIVANFQKRIEAEVQEIKALDKEKLEGYGKQLGDTMAAVKLLSEMLQTVYANSTTISMPVKNMISQKHVEICNLINEEKKDG
jgi:hypothetical protein